MRFIIILLISICSTSVLGHQQQDQLYQPKNEKVTFHGDKRPVVFIDEAHNNFHTMEGKYNPFAKALLSDGYDVRKSTKRFSADTLKDVDILVVANALADQNVESWRLPNYSAFTRGEIEVIYHWVKNGGSLFLIADHMPFPKAAESLAAIFGFQFNNGYARDRIKENSDIIFNISTKTLNNHPIVKGMESSEAISSIRTFTGQAFLIPMNARPLLTFPANIISKMPSESWGFEDSTPEISVEGWSQGATLDFHQGRIAVFGEAAMFTSQHVEREDKERDSWVGLNARDAKQNEQFLLNIMHWLSRKIN